MAAGGSQLVGKKRCRDIEALPKGRAEDEEDTVILHVEGGGQHPAAPPESGLRLSSGLPLLWP